MSDFRILVVGAGHPIPSFIARRLKALVRSGTEVVLVASSDQSIDRDIASEVIRVGRIQNIFELLKRVAYLMMHFRVFMKLLTLKPSLSFFFRVKWAFKFLPVACAKRIKAIHFQWIGHVPEFEWIRYFQSCPFIASARGSQVTVYPVTRLGYLDIIRRAFDLTDYIHCVSKSIAARCQQLGAKPEKIFVNYNGLDLETFRVLRRGDQPASKFTLISVGALMWRKGNLFQLQILKRLVDAGRDVRLLLIGDGPDLESLKYTAHVLGVEDHVEFVGAVDEHELSSWLGRSDLYLSTSIAEGLANSVVESAAAGLPILTFACNGMDEIVQAGVNGFILPFGDVDGMVDKIGYLIDHIDIRMQMGHSSRMKAVKDFDETYWVELMIKKYRITK